MGAKMQRADHLWCDRLLRGGLVRSRAFYITTERGAPPNKFPILSILKLVFRSKKTEIINQVKLREACLLFTVYCLLFREFQKNNYPKSIKSAEGYFGVIRVIVT